MQVDKVITNARVVTPTGVIDGGVGIQGEKIACIFGGQAHPEAGEIIDAKNQYLLPGLVDCHSHHGSYRSFAEDMKLNSAASVIGGVTTMGVMTKVTNMRHERIDKPTEKDVVSYLQHYDEAEDVVKTHSSADAAFIFSIMTDEHAREVTKYAEVAGVNTFKFYFGYRDPRMWQSAPATLGLPVHWDDGTAYLAFKRIADIGGLALCHAECNELVRVLVEDTWASGKTGLEAWNDKSPGFVEAHDIRTIGSLSQWTGASFYIVHCSSLESVHEIKRCKEDGLDVMAETEAHYLTFALDDERPAGGNWAKQNLPIRTQLHREALWDAIGSGVLDTLATDNVGGSAKLLQKEDDIWHCRPGFDSVQFTLPVMMDHVASGKLSMQKLAELSATNGARALRLYPRKGAIMVGSDADLVIADPDLRHTATAMEMVSGSDYSIYEGRSVQGWPTLTLLRGEVVAKDGELVGKTRGIPLRRS